MLWLWYFFPLFFLLVADFLLVTAIFRDPAAGRSKRLAAGFVVGITLLVTDANWAPVAVAWLGVCLFEFFASDGGRRARVRRAATLMSGMSILSPSFLSIPRFKKRLRPFV